MYRYAACSSRVGSYFFVKKIKKQQIYSSSYSSVVESIGKDSYRFIPVLLPFYTGTKLLYRYRQSDAKIFILQMCQQQDLIGNFILQIWILISKPANQDQEIFRTALNLHVGSQLLPGQAAVGMPGRSSQRLVRYPGATDHEIY